MASTTTSPSIAVNDNNNNVHTFDNNKNDTRCSVIPSDTQSSTTTTAKTDTAPAARCTLLALPLEIRRHIYSFLFSAANNRCTTDDDRIFYRFSLDLFATNRQIASEAREVFEQRNVFIALDTPWPVAEHHVRDQGRVPMIASGERAQNFKDAHMLVQINTREATYSDSFLFVILADDLDRFCRFWYYSDLSYPGLNRALTLKVVAKPLLTKRQTFARDLQRRLLVPFGDIKDLDDLSIEGFDEDVKDSLIIAQAQPYESPESCLERCGQLKDAGDLSIKQKNYNKALSQYFAAFEAIHITIDGRERRVWADAFFDLNLRSGRHVGENANILRIEFRIRLVAAVVDTYTHLQQWDDAYFWGNRSISLMRENLGPAADEPRNPLPAHREWGLIYFWTGRACKHLNKSDEARELFQIAHKWLPSNNEVKQELRAAGGIPAGYGNYVTTEEA